MLAALSVPELGGAPTFALGVATHDLNPDAEEIPAGEKALFYRFLIVGEAPVPVAGEAPAAAGGAR